MSRDSSILFSSKSCLASSRLFLVSSQRTKSIREISENLMPNIGGVFSSKKFVALARNASISKLDGKVP